MENKIIWTDNTINFSTGCTKCSLGCLNCYAERMANRLHGMIKQPKTHYKYRNNFSYTEHLNEWLDTKLPEKPCRVFVNSMSDTFHEKASVRHIRDTFYFFSTYPQHTFQILTKRPKNIPDWIEWPDNVHLGVTICNQEESKKIFNFLLVPAKFHFLSIEPMLGPIDLCRGGFSFLERLKSPSGTQYGKLDLVIVGGESGPCARPMNIEWVRSIRDQCKESNTPFIFKQWSSCDKIKDNCLDGEYYTKYPEVK